MHIVVHDLHYPKWNKVAFAALLDFLRQNSRVVESFVFGGDQFDNEVISHHTKGKPLYRVTGGYKRDQDGFLEEVLNPLEAVLPKGCRKIFITGNHERFEQDFIEEHPELEGIVSHVEGLQLAKKGWEIIPLGHATKIGKLVVIHGEILTGIGNQAGAFPAKRAVELYGASVLAGHTHAPQSFTKVSPVDHTQKHMGWIAPIMGATNPSYLRNRPTAWVNGFTLVETFDDGNFNVYPIIISGGKFSFAGKVYGETKKKKKKQ
jgi:hypothetical protein